MKLLRALKVGKPNFFVPLDNNKEDIIFFDIPKF
jgi:hypothetical protein